MSSNVACLFLYWTFFFTGHYWTFLDITGHWHIKIYEFLSYLSSLMSNDPPVLPLLFFYWKFFSLDITGRCPPPPPLRPEVEKFKIGIREVQQSLYNMTSS